MAASVRRRGEHADRRQRGRARAVLVGACAVLVAHNHPSGDATPSAEDREITRRLVDAGALLGIPLLDSLVWTRAGAHVSLREASADLFVPRDAR